MCVIKGKDMEKKDGKEMVKKDGKEMEKKDGKEMEKKDGKETEEGEKERKEMFLHELLESVHNSDLFFSIDVFPFLFGDFHR